MAPDRMLMAAEVNGQGVDFKVRAARPLFAVPTTPGGYSYDVAKDGQRFLVDGARRLRKYRVSRGRPQLASRVEAARAGEMKPSAPYARRGRQDRVGK